MVAPAISSSTCRSRDRARGNPVESRSDPAPGPKRVLAFMLRFSISLEWSKGHRLRVRYQPQIRDTGIRSSAGLVLALFPRS